MPTARKFNRKWFALWHQAIRNLGAAAQKCDRIREANRGGGLTAVKTRLQAAELGNMIRQVALDLNMVEWEPARENDDTP